MNELIFKYFPNLTDLQLDRFRAIHDIYAFWNNKINVISRKDMENFTERHVLHSLGIAKIVAFENNLRIMDAGTGGGFPGIPLSILYPEVNFVLVDSIGKKIKVVQSVISELGLTNVETIQSRIEDVNDQFDYIVSRAVTSLPDFLQWTRKKIAPSVESTSPNGILYLKGGELEQELSQVKLPYSVHNLSDYFREDFFATKKLVYIRLN